jgi:hypothetical protein
MAITEIVNRQLHATGEFVIGREDDLDIGIGLQGGLGLISRWGCRRIADGAEASLLDNIEMICLELLPDLVTPIQRR